LALYLTHGITGVRDMGSHLDRAKQWRQAIDKGELVGPHIETCGPPFDGFPSDNANRPVTMVRSPSDARAAYDSLDDRSVDFIGVLPRLPRDAYFALIERARKYYSPVAGAVPATVSALEAVDNRQRSIDQMSVSCWPAPPKKEGFADHVRWYSIGTISPNSRISKRKRLKPSTQKKLTRSSIAWPSSRPAPFPCW